jgi:hypothetical protein
VDGGGEGAHAEVAAKSCAIGPAGSAPRDGMWGQPQTWAPTWRTRVGQVSTAGRSIAARDER